MFQVLCAESSELTGEQWLRRKSGEETSLTRRWVVFWKGISVSLTRDYPGPESDSDGFLCVCRCY